jgi:hypothetical protein
MSTPEVTSPNVSVGLATQVGIVVSIVSALGALVGAIEGNDVATASGAAAGVLAAITTIGGRMAQAVAALRAGARVAGPWVDAAQEALREPPASRRPPL